MTRYNRHTTIVLTVITFIVLTGCDQNSQSTKQKIVQSDTNKKLRLLTYGEPPDLEGRNAENVIADKWGIEYYSVAGCNVTQELIDRVDKHNKEVEVLIESKFGKSWQSSFDKEVKEELIKQKIASSLLDKEEIINKKQKELAKEGNGIHYRFQPINKNEYKASVTGWGQINGKDEYVSYFRYLVNIENKKIKLTSTILLKE